MLLFGHAGLTLGAATLLARSLAGRRFFSRTDNEATEPSRDFSQAAPTPSAPPRKQASRLTTLGNYMDVRVLLVGSLLPDIIDKPLGIFFFRETLSNGRIFCHTLLFLLAITVFGLYLYRRPRQTWLLVLAFGTFTHLILDQMWRSPRTLFWPLYGFAFDREDVTEWIPNLLRGLARPEVGVPELVGLAIVIWFALALWHRKVIHLFLRHGRVR